MPTLRQLRDRVKSLKNTQQITRAMKMVAGARIRRAELAMRAARPYAAAIGEMLTQLGVAGGGSLSHPLVESRDGEDAWHFADDRRQRTGGRVQLESRARGARPKRAATTSRSAYLVGTKGRMQLRRAPYRRRPNSGR